MHIVTREAVRAAAQLLDDSPASLLAADWLIELRQRFPSSSSDAAVPPESPLDRLGVDYGPLQHVLRTLLPSQAEYEAARDEARATVGAAAWVAVSSFDESGPVHRSPAGRWREFDASVPSSGTAAEYVGERPVAREWLDRREAALAVVRSDYEAARDAARAAAGGAGWVGVTSVDESGQPIYAHIRPTVFVPDASVRTVVIGHDESGDPIHAQRSIVGHDEGGSPLYGAPSGWWLEFDEAAFAAHYRAQGGPALQALAALYDSDVASLFAQHPELWAVATTDHERNAGPPPPGFAMAGASVLALVDLGLADPFIGSLIEAYGGTPPPPTGAVAIEQASLYGAQRYAQLSRFGTAMQVVRERYVAAMEQARLGGGPGWTEKPLTIAFNDESGAAQTRVVTDESGQPQMRRVFDPDAFTAWYLRQPGLANQAFARFYGASHTEWGRDESGAPSAGGSRFDKPQWSLWLGAMSHHDLLSIDPNAPPSLHDPHAVFFDWEAGWVTPHGNVRHKRDWAELLVIGGIVTGVSIVSFGTLGFGAAEALGMTVVNAAGVTVLTAGGIVVASTVAGAASSFVGGLLRGNLTLKGVLQGALAGALSAGLMQGLGAWAAQAGPLGTIALRTTVQGGIQALLGGRFEDGAIAGFATALAQEVVSQMKLGIDAALAEGLLTPGEALAAQQVAHLIGSAIRAAADPGNIHHAFANEFLNDLIQQAGTPARPPVYPAFDDDGNVMPGVVDPKSSFAEQVAQLRAHLVAQGLSTEVADSVAGRYAQQVLDEAGLAFVSAQPPATLLAGPWTPEVHGAREVIDAIEARIADGPLSAAEVGRAIDEAYQAYLQLAAGAERAGAPPTVDQERAAMRLITLISDLGQLARDDRQPLTPAQQQLVLQSQALQWQRSLPDVYGAAAAGGILALRQSRYLQAMDAWAAKPHLRHPDTLIGRSEGGPGQWDYSPRRTGGQDYQEAATGVPRGIEYRVGDVYFDGYDAARRVAIDAKDWKGYPPPGTRFWQEGVVKEANDQLAALKGTGVRLEWRVSSEQAASELRAAFRAESRSEAASPLLDIKIIVMKP